MNFPGEDSVRSLAEMAQRDLDAALQLLADRAQYITGAGGAAIALRRDGNNDLLCRASAGANAPELGALLSAEFGLSGESVRTRTALRCDDAERDARVNREVCRELGIASVVVMPVVHDDQVLGVFELFSGKAHAFGDRDLTALERLSGMVETVVRLARAAQTVPDKLQAAVESVESAVEVAVEETATQAAESANALPAVAVEVRTEPSVQEAAPVVAAPAKDAVVERRLYWSAALSASGEGAAMEKDQSHVPPVLRNLRKCEACGFPVSAGRTHCVECEEKKWRGQLKPKGVSQASPASGAVAAAPAVAREAPAAAPAPSAAVSSDPVAAADASFGARNVPTPDFVLSAGLAPSQSWVARNKFVVAAIVLTAAVIVGIVFLR